MVCLLEAEPSTLSPSGFKCFSVSTFVIIIFFFFAEFLFLFVWGRLGAGVNFEYTRKGWIGNLCVQGVAFQSETCLVRNKAN